MAAALLLIAAPHALAAAAAPPDVLDGVFYTFGIAATIFYTALILVIGPLRFLSFGAFAALMLLLWSTLDGTLTWLVGGSQRFADSAPLVAAGLLAGFGFLQAAWAIDSPHRYDALKPVLIALGACCLIIPFGLPFFSYFALYLPMNVLVLVMLVLQVLPPLTWRSLSPQQHRWALLTPIAMAAATLLVYAAHFSFVGFSRPELDVINRALFLGYVVFSLATATANVLAIARDKEDAEKTTLLADKRSAEARLALLAAERRYAEVQAVAAEKARQLASASQDLKAPIEALRAALEQTAAPGNRAARMLEAVDYLDRLAGAYVNEASLDAAYHESEDAEAVSGEAAEIVQLSLLIATLSHMFARDADQRGVRLGTVDSGLEVIAAPLVLMRMLSNLVANALQHGQANRVLIGVRRLPGEAALQVIDDGVGMTPEALAGHLEPGATPADPDGGGLGLAVVREFAASHGYGFTIRSMPGRGTCAEIRVPRALRHDRV